MKQIGMVVAMFGWVIGAHAAAGCVMVGNSQATIQTDNKELTAPLRLANCDGAKVISGSVSVCFLNDKSQRTCRNLKEGEHFDAKLFSANTNAGTGTFRATLASLFKGDPQSRIGQTRDNPPYPGFPYKQILMPAGDLVIQLRTPKTRRIESFTLTPVANQSQTVSISTIDGQLRVPAAALMRGNEYTWEAHGEKISFHGRFLVASESEQAEIVGKAATITADDSLDATGRQILRAESYFENGYVFDAESLMEQVGEGNVR